MTAELALVDQAASIDVGRWVETLTFAVQLADKVHDTEFVPAALRGRPEAVAATIMYGAEVGVTPMQALAGIHIVEGRPAPSAELMRAMILRAGHAFTIHEMTGTRVRVSGLRRGRPENERVVVEWSLDMARAAGLLGRRNWQNYPRAMLTARATGDLARILFADVVKGLGYVAEDASVVELDGWAGDTQEPAQKAPRKRLQRAQRRAAPVVVEEPDDAQNAVSELPPVAPPSSQPATPAAASPSRAGAARGEQTAPVPEPEPPDDGPDYDPPALSPEVVGDALAEVRAEIAQKRERYDPVDVPLPPELQPQAPVSHEPPVPSAEPPTIAPGPLKALHAGLTRELGTVATREEKQALLAAILGHPVGTTKELTRNEGYRVLDYLDRFATGAAAWKLDIATGAVTIVDTVDEPPDDDGGET